jgi:ankyrin repeat protein
MIGHHCGLLPKMGTKPLLAQMEIEVNSEDLHESMTPLWCAVKHGHSRVIKLLIAQKEVIVDSQGTDDHSLLWLAAKHGNDELNLKNLYGR